MDELGEDARGLLQAFRAGEHPSKAQREAIWNELEASGSTDRPRRKVPPTSRDRASAASPKLPRRSATTWMPLAALAVAAALVLVWSRWGALDRLSTEPSVAERPPEAAHQLESRKLEGVAVPLERRPAAAAADGGEAREVMPLDAKEVENTDAENTEARTRAPSGSKTRPERPGDELGIIERAQRALREGDAARALELLERHRRLHPDAALAQERELLRAQALCDTGRLGEARALAAEFVAARPESAYAGKMRRVCVQRPSGGGG
jgi:hypothetical protein